MVQQIASCALVAHSVKYHIDTFPSGKLGRRYKVGISSDNYNLGNLALECKRCDVEPKPHVYALLLGIDFKVGI